MHTHSPEERLAQLAGGQHGVVSFAQLRELGFSQQAIFRRVQAGRLHSVHRGVYSVGHTALTRDSRDLAAVLACGPGAALSHRSAGVQWALIRRAPRIEVTCLDRHPRRPGIVVHRSRSLDRDDRDVVDAIPVTSPARTLVDLAEVLSERRLGDAVHEAEVQRLFDLWEIERVLARLRGRRGRHKLGRVIAAYDGGPPVTRSNAEKRFLRICADHAIPTPQANVSLAGYEVDFYWPDAALVVETDGAGAHQTRKAFHEDRRRDRALAALGIQVLRVTWRDLGGDGVALAREIEAVRRGRAAGPRC